MNQENQKKCIVVLGMHRSGTSAVAGLLANAGIFFGDNLLEAHSDNIKGFYENKSLLNINENILKVLGSSWDDVSELPEKWYERPEVTLFKLNIKQTIEDQFNVSIFGIKEPRISILLPLYLDVFKSLNIEPYFLVVKRKKIEIARSLEKRNNFSYEKSLSLTGKYINSINKYTKDYENKFEIFFDSIVNNPKLFLINFQKIFNVNLNTGVDALSFVEKNLKHNNISYNYLIQESNKSIEELNKTLEESNKTLEESNKTLEESNKSIEELNKTLRNYADDLKDAIEEKDLILLSRDKLKLKIEDLQDQLYHSEEEVISVKSSLTWRFSQRLFRLVFIIFPDNRKTRQIAENIIFFLRRVFIGKSTYTSDVLKPSDKELINNPLISIILPTYNSDPKFLDLAIKSVKNQTYKKWELCISDDGSTNLNTINYLKKINDKQVKVILNDKNEGISSATNKGIGICSGEYVAFLDHDDELVDSALYHVVKSINDNDPDLIYSDEDTVDKDGNFLFAHYKPNYSPDLLMSQNYVCHFMVVRKKILDTVGKMNSSFDGSQDYDIVLRISEVTDKIFHIPKVLYHWRQVEGSASVSRDNKDYAILKGKNALEESLKRRGVEAEVFIDEMTRYYRVKRKILGDPLVSIIISFKNSLDVTKKCVDSILIKTTYKNYEIVIVDHSSDEPEIEGWKKEVGLVHKNVFFVDFEGEFNYSKINNYATKFSNGEHLIFLNNDTEIITEDWIESMLEHSQRKEVGVVGAKLYYPDNTIQHAGVIIGIGGIAGHAHRRLRSSNSGYFARASIIQNISAVTGACMMVKKEIFVNTGGLDELLQVAFNDIDFCLKVRGGGYLNVYTPYAQLYHHESYSRGSDSSPEKQKRFQKEVHLFKKRHGKILREGDPYYNINLSLTKESFAYSNDVLLKIHTEKNNSLFDKKTIKDFDWQAYVSNYEDLQKAGINNLERAYKHWLEFGMAEGRKWQ